MTRFNTWRAANDRLVLICEDDGALYDVHLTPRGLTVTGMSGPDKTRLRAIEKAVQKKVETAYGVETCSIDV